MISKDHNSFDHITNLDLKTALVYDRVNTNYGGAEQVLLALHELFPQAPLYTSVYHQNKARWAQSLSVKSSFLQSCSWARSHHRWVMPLMPLAFEQLDLSDYDLIISVSSAEAKGVISKPDQLHLNYMLTPPRYLYSHRQQYLQSRSILKLPGIKLIVRKLLDYQTWWDQAAAHRPDAIVPLSRLVKARAKKYYNLTTLDPIYPPADMIDLNIKPSKQQQQQLEALHVPNNYCLIVTRLVNYKQVDVAIKACQETDENLIIIGEGPDKKRLKKLVKISPKRQQIHLIGSQPQPIVNCLMKQARGVLALGIEDFGLVPLQANFLGTPAIINHQSGVAEVIRKEGAIKISDLSTQTVAAALKTLHAKKWDQTAMKVNAQKYTHKRFLFNFKNVITSLVSS